MIDSCSGKHNTIKGYLSRLYDNSALVIFNPWCHEQDGNNPKG